MEQQQTQDQAPRGGLSHSGMDAIASVVIFLIGVVMMIDNYKLGAGWASDGPESGYFPLRIGAILCIASVVVLLKSLFGKARKHEIFVSWKRFKLVLMVLLPTGVYVLAIQFLGIYVASALFIAAFMRVMDKYSWLKTLLVSVAVSVALYWMFEVQFMVPLPKGPLEALLGF
ncbi:MAG: tripartite tricarboxylate transporter TctB family protein [Burkholderiales bacterium]|nr:tripartite tricarboxylate transporter TctB family protein [Burkholderiales bacterium]